MRALKWGGRFRVLDRVSGLPVDGTVFGEIDGLEPAQEEEARAKALSAFTLAAAHTTTPLADEAARAQLAACVGADLMSQGLSCRVRIDGIRIQRTDASGEINATPPAPARPSYAPGANVNVQWSDGATYQGTVLEVSEGYYRVRFPDGQEHWVDGRFLSS